MFRRRYKKCYCMNNSYQNNSYEMQSDMIEKQGDNVASYEDYRDDCSCGFDEEYEMSVFPDNPMLAQSYVPWQYMDKTFKPEIGLKMGTIYPELVSPYFPGQSQKEIEYIEATNKIREGCNKC